MAWLTMLLCLAAAPPTPTAYALYHGDGSGADFGAMVEAMAAAEVVLFGELHNDRVAHELQRSVAQALAEQTGDRLILGAEMLERDQQLIVDEYLIGAIRAADLTSGTKLWPNWQRDYAPLLELAKERKLRVVATNVPRRYAAMVARDGWPALESLDAEAKGLMAGLPVMVDTNLPGYQALLKGDTHGGKIKPELLVAAQALKDATMAESIHRALPPNGLMLHLNGAYHSNNREGIVWYLQRLRPNAKVVTVNTVQAADPGQLPAEAKLSADYILVTNEALADSTQE